MERELRAETGTEALGRGSPAMKLGNPLDDRKAEAGGPLSRRRLGRQPLESAENPREILGRQAWPVVAYAANHSGTIGRNRNLDRAADRRILDGIADEIVDGLAQTFLIAVHAHTRQSLQRKGLLLSIRRRSVGGDDLRHERHEVERIAADRDIE